MVEILEAPANVVAIRITGELIADDYAEIREAIDSVLAEYERIGMFVDLTGMTGISAGALGEDVRTMFDLRGELDRFERNAIVATEDWVERLSEAAERFVPGVELRTFDPADADEALAWAAGAGFTRR